jgi:AcrR family transcriptional regulator
MVPDRIRLSRETLLAAIGDHWPPAQVDAAAELLAGSGGKFPAGVRKLPSDLISAIQRERLIAAMLRAVAELGHRDVNVQDVLDRAGVSRPTFYEHFSNKEDCFLTAFDNAASRLRGRVAEAAETGGGRWRDQVRRGLEELLRFCADDSDAARVVIVETRGASPTALLRRDELLEHFAGCLEEKAREQLPTATPRSPVTAAGVVGGIEALIYVRLSKDGPGGLESLLPSLTYFAVLPYEGPQVASKELAAASG